MAKAKKTKAKKSKTRKSKAKKSKAKKAVKRAAAASSRKVKKSKAKRPKKAAKKSAPAKAAKKAAPKKTKPVMGEGDYQASRKFQKDEATFVKRHNSEIPKMGKDAEAALAGPQGGELRAAEEEARGHTTSMGGES